MTRLKADLPARQWVPWVVLIIALLLTAAATAYVYLTARMQDEARFDSAVHNVTDSINDRVESYVLLLRATAGLAAAQPNLSLADFRAYVDRLQVRQRLPGVQGIGLALRVSAEDKDGLVQRMRQQDIESLRDDHAVPFTIWPDTPRGEYTAIVYLEPLDRRNQAAIGYDMFTEPTRHAAMLAACESGTAVASGKVTLVQEIDRRKQTGFLIYVPIYRGGGVPPPEKRRDLLVGFAYAPFRTRDLLAGIFGSEPHRLVDFELYDGTRPDADHLMLEASAPVRRPSHVSVEHLTLAARPWTLVFLARPEFDSGSGSVLLPMVPALGLLVGILMFGLTRAQVLAVAEAQHAAAELRKSERALRGTERKLIFLADASKLLASSLDYEKTLDSLARLAVPYLADWCVIYAMDRSGAIRRMAVVYANPDRAPLADELRRQRLDMNDENNLIVRTIRRGEPVLLPTLGDADLPRIAHSEEYLSLLRRMSVRSVIIAPIFAHGQTVGAVKLVSAESDRHYAADDLAFAQELASRASSAVENARLYQSAQEARAEAERANRLKDEFLATVSHELRTPLNAILGWSQLLNMQNNDPETQQQGLEAIQRNARAQAQLVEDLLDVSRIITGKLHLNVRPIELAPVIRAAIDTVHPAAQARGIRLDADFDAHAGPVLGDANRLQQVVWNLLANAIKFTPRGGSVTVRARRFDSQAEITVTDTGQGIDPEFMPQLFTAFRQADGTTTRRHGGLGLGLAIVRHLVELHGGSVSASSEGLGKGSTFTVRLPIPAVIDEQPPSNSPAAPPAARTSAHLDGLSIVVVDDEPDARALVHRVLTDAGASVHAAGSAPEALNLVREVRPDVLVSDIAMPGEDGYSLLHKVRSLPENLGRDTPAVALTAYAREEDRQKTAAAGFQLHIAKPVEPDQLVAMIAALTGSGSPQNS